MTTKKQYGFRRNLYCAKMLQAKTQKEADRYRSLYNYFNRKVDGCTPAPEKSFTENECMTEALWMAD